MRFISCIRSLKMVRIPEEILKRADQKEGYFRPDP